MHHTEWNIGESAGVLAAYCLAHQLNPHQVHGSRDKIDDVQRQLASDGVRLAWPWEKK